MSGIRICVSILAIAGALTAWGAAPYIGYAYPAGGQQGTVVRVMVGGQRISGVRDVVFSGAGVQAKFVQYEGGGGPLNFQQREFLMRRVQELIAKLKPAPAPAVTPPATPPTTPETPAKPVTLPDLPDLRNLDQLTLPQLRRIQEKYLRGRKSTKPPIAEDVTLEVTIAPDAAPGDRELRLLTSLGLSNPLIFQVGRLPEICEKDRLEPTATAPPPADAPVVLNGQIMPGEVDHFTLKLKAGQHLVMAAQAQHLIPYLADGVPGWAQLTLALEDADGRQLAFADDTGGNPDPSLICRIARDGDYRLVIRDAIYRGREDFVYRVTVSEQAPEQTLLPFAPLGRVPRDGVPADATALLPCVDSQLPAGDEIEPNDTTATAMKITVPQLITGQIAQAGDADCFRFTGKAGDVVVADVYARRLGSSLDALLRLSDAAGRVLAWNDDTAHGEMGLLTHQADAYLSTKLPADGVYTVQVSDAQRHGGEAYRYYLRVSPPQPDFALRLTPSGINIPAGSSASVTVYAFRQDGWNGEIEIVFADAPAGFALGSARIPAGQDSAVIALKAPRKALENPVVLRLLGRAQIDGNPLTRPVIPADRRMQAFAYYHLVPAQQLLVMVTRR